MQRRRLERRKSRPSEAERADAFELYERSVQDVDYDCDLVERMFSRRYGRPPRFLPTLGA